MTGKQLDKLIKDERSVMVEFWGSWCPPCQRMGEVLSNIEKKFDGKLAVAKVNIDRNPMVSKQFDVLGVPAFVFFKNGEIVHREVGARSEKQLHETINRLMEDE